MRREDAGRLRRTGALLPLSLLLIAPRIAAAELPLDGITIGSSVAALARALGAPASVASADSGQRFVFPSGAIAYADDDGVVLAVDLPAGSPRVEVDGTVLTFPIGEYSTARADVELADAAEFTTPTLRSYRLAPRRDLVLSFAESTNRLDRVSYGEPGQLVRLGLLPGDPAATAVAYRAPRLRRAGSGPAPSGAGASVYRIAIDRSGAVRAVEVVIASGSPQSDAEATRGLQADRYFPATLDGRPIAATIFVELSH
jgi:hypothetical protein